MMRRAVYYYDEMVVEVVYGQDPDNSGNDVWGFYQLDAPGQGFFSGGADLNGTEVWYVDDDDVPTYETVYECIVKPNVKEE